MAWWLQEGAPGRPLTLRFRTAELRPGCATAWVGQGPPLSMVAVGSLLEAWSWEKWREATLEAPTQLGCTREAEPYKKDGFPDSAGPLLTTAQAWGPHCSHCCVICQNSSRLSPGPLKGVGPALDHSWARGRETPFFLS